jgi:hypothetical protein
MCHEAIDQSRSLQSWWSEEAWRGKNVREGKRSRKRKKKKRGETIRRKKEGERGGEVGKVTWRTENEKEWRQKWAGQWEWGSVGRETEEENPFEAMSQEEGWRMMPGNLSWNPSVSLSYHFPTTIRGRPFKARAHDLMYKREEENINGFLCHV